MSEFSNQSWRWVPGLLRRDLVRKLIALVFAVLVWKKVSTQIGTEEVRRDVRVEITAPAGIEILDEELPRKIEVTVRGSPRRLNLLQSSDLKAELQIRPGQHQGEGQETLQLRIRRDEVQAPAGVTVISVRPEIMTVNIDRRTTKTLPVRIPAITGELMGNYAYGKIKMIPETVTVSGPDTMLRLLEAVSTSPLVLQRENTDTFETEVELRPQHGLQATPNQVRVQVEIYRKYENRHFRSMRVAMLQPEGTAAKMTTKLNLDRVDVVVYGLKDAVTGISEQGVKPFVDLAGMDQPGKYRVPVQVWLAAPEIEVRGVMPATIEVLVEAR